jgi:hypothetical protein
MSAGSELCTASRRRALVLRAMVISGTHTIWEVITVLHHT